MNNIKFRDLRPAFAWLVKEKGKTRKEATPHKSLESLINALRREWDALDQEMIYRLVEQFPWRLQACIDAEGGHFEE